MQFPHFTEEEHKRVKIWPRSHGINKWKTSGLEAKCYFLASAFLDFIIFLEIVYILLKQFKDYGFLFVQYFNTSIY